MVQIVTNSADLQAYAAEQVLVKLREGSAHESMLKISGAVPLHDGRCSSAELTRVHARLPAWRVWTPAADRARRILRIASATLRRVQLAHQGIAALSVCKGVCVASSCPVQL